MCAALVLKWQWHLMKMSDDEWTREEHQICPPASLEPDWLMLNVDASRMIGWRHNWKGYSMWKGALIGQISGIIKIHLKSPFLNDKNIKNFFINKNDDSYFPKNHNPMAGKRQKRIWWAQHAKPKIWLCPFAGHLRIVLLLILNADSGKFAHMVVSMLLNGIYSSFCGFFWSNRRGF